MRVLLKEYKNMSDLDCKNGDLPDEISINDWDNNCEPACVNIKEKSGDKLLIELYRERPFLYDKSNTNFKDCLMRQNAWIEISKIMTQVNCGDMYTPSYCQKRCISLRDQYSREKRKAEIKSKSGNAAAKATQFPFFSQLAFLDHVIKRRRRRSYTNCTKPQMSIVNKDSNTSQNVGNENKSEHSNNEENENKHKQHIHNTKYFNKEHYAPKIKKRKVDETKELKHTLIQMGHKSSSYMEKKVLTDEVLTTDDAFMEILKVQFNSIPEKEKNIRRKMIMDALTAPLPEKIHQRDCECNILFKKFLISTFSH